ncbi:hypothetical protein QBC39DRAFT_432839 [Podospora conica]|nr:hypothetical protein QBC39DRAFT_432839 [Schizothecium conicum]
MTANQPPLTLTLSSNPSPSPNTEEELAEDGTILIPLSLTITNTSPTSTPFTVLTWSSPFDPLVFRLGLLSLAVVDTTAESETETPIPINRIMLRRRTPPDADSYVVTEPEQSVTRSVVCRLEPPGVDVDGKVVRGKTVRFPTRARTTDDETKASATSPVPSARI